VVGKRCRAAGGLRLEPSRLIPLPPSGYFHRDRRGAMAIAAELAGAGAALRVWDRPVVRGRRMRIAILAAAAASLAACSAGPAPWRAETVPVLVIAQAEPQMPRCPPIATSITMEALHMTPLEPMREGGINALAAALMRSEAEKNARLRQAMIAYERCRVRAW
jgi:hypothetical protein